MGEVFAQDWPLSREEKKVRVMDFYRREGDFVEERMDEVSKQADGAYRENAELRNQMHVMVVLAKKLGCLTNLPKDVRLELDDVVKCSQAVASGQALTDGTDCTDARSGEHS